MNYRKVYRAQENCNCWATDLKRLECNVGMKHSTASVNWPLYRLGRNIRPKCHVRCCMPESSWSVCKMEKQYFIVTTVNVVNIAMEADGIRQRERRRKVLWDSVKRLF